MSAKLCNYCDRPAVRIIPYPRGRFLDAGYLSLCQIHAEYISVSESGEIRMERERRDALEKRWEQKIKESMLDRVLTEEEKHEVQDR